MIEAKILTEEYKEEFNKAVRHPLQSWAWGEFKEKNNCIVERIGFFENERLVDGVQVVFSKLPKTKFTVGLAVKGSFPSELQIKTLKELAKKHNAIFIKLEPNSFYPVLEDFILKDTDEKTKGNFSETVNKTYEEKTKELFSFGLKKGRAFFKDYDFHLDINKNEEELLASFHSKTRYNIKLAKKRGVEILDNSTQAGIENYIRLMEETTKRQNFFNHNGEYFKKLFEAFPKNQLRIFEAVYNSKVLTSWILFNFNGILYYPYGASSSEHREVMPNNLIAWQAIKFGKEQACTSFDMWGCLGPNPDKKNPWYGFHKFKAGYNPQLVKYIGSYDLICKPVLYRLFNFAYALHWMLLKMRK